MKVLVVGGGGREHALVWKLAQSPLVDKIFAAPGNPGMKGLATLVDIGADDVPALKEFAQDQGIGLTVVGPEAALVAGLTDSFQADGLLVAGPDAYAAQLEGSKAFAKEMMNRLRVPTADYAIFEDPEDAKMWVRQQKRPLVVKADGLAAGKGVLVCDDEDQAVDAIEQCMVARAFGEAGRKVVIEERLEGEEASFLVFSDGKSLVAMPSSQDHKAVFEGDLGPNTGGMGAYSPAPVVTPKVAEMAQWWVCNPIIQSLAREGHPYKGVLYAGLMIDAKGDPKVLEFNCRFGDPECQPLMMRLDSDLAEILLACAQGNLNQVEVKWSPQRTVCVVLASGGYPGKYDKGKEISGLDQAGSVPEVEVFHAGTAEKDGRIVTAGGRVLGVTARGETVRQATERAYRAADMISWEDMYLRRDIAYRALAREGKGHPGIYKGGAMTGPTAAQRRAEQEAAEAARQAEAAKVGTTPLVAVVMGSASDKDVMAGATGTLRELEIPYEARVISAHRTPLEAAEFSSGAAGRGIKVIIAGAGWAAHLGGVLAASTTLPVIGVPIDSSALNGMDALLATVQMPPGVPVATVSIGKGGATNAAILAAQIIALGDPDLAQRLALRKEKMAQGVKDADESLDL